MMRMKSKTRDGSAVGKSEWERRPGGMLVQKRSPDSHDNHIAPPPTIAVRVKYGSIYHQINISSQATFGELKKMLSGQTGLHYEDQKLLFKDKDRDSRVYLDIAGVKDRSKMILVDDPISREKRFLEMRRNAKIEKASKFISEISLEVDKLAGQVAAIESVISRGAKVTEKQLLTLTDHLMNQLLKLDGITVDGDAKLEMKKQVTRVQKYVECLDILKLKNSAVPIRNGSHGLSPVESPRFSRAQIATENEQQQSRRSIGHTQQPPPPSRHSTSAVVVTTQWETFDSVPIPLPTPPSNNGNHIIHPNHSWDLLL